MGPLRPLRLLRLWGGLRCDGQHELAVRMHRTPTHRLCGDGGLCLEEPGHGAARVHARQFPLCGTAGKHGTRGLVHGEAMDFG